VHIDRIINKHPKKLLYILGTRPEAIKLAPLINLTKTQPDDFETVVCVSAQHREMLDAVLNFFKIVPDYDLNIMKPGQNLFEITNRSLIELAPIFDHEKPDLVLVQGDTTTAFTGALAAYYSKIPTGHIEAGLRTHDIYNPFPEEMNRKLVGSIASYHFAPTSQARHNLQKENVPDDRIWVTGNTVVDALMLAMRIQSEDWQDQHWDAYFKEKWRLDLSDTDRKNILVTGHRRENFGQGFISICSAIKEIACNHPDVNVIYPVHLNPNVRKPVESILGPMSACHKDTPCSGGAKNVFLIDPLDYAPFVYLMKKAYMILTDSGGVQEEAPSLGKPVLVMRNETERSEGVEAGTSKLVGTHCQTIITETEKLLTDVHAYDLMAKMINPYGDGHACQRISEVLRNA
jgi:UDP-N-acetylglucosamine 2-epimerase (non-hydrolysing)